MQACLDLNLTPVLSSWHQLHDLVELLGSERTVSTHLKFDTGMNRLGFESREAFALRDFLIQHPQIQLDGLLTHLHSGENMNQENETSESQRQDLHRLNQLFQLPNQKCHVLNSAGLLGLAQRLQEPVNEGARPGLALYGVSPLAGKFEQELKPVMSFRSQLIRIKKIQKGEGVSYSHRWKADRDSWIGIVPVGYADGFHRLLSNQTEVLVGGKRVPIRGSICMDYFMVDLTDLTGGSGGEGFLWSEVTLFGYDSKGNRLDVIEIARLAQTIPWEILTSVGERVPRRILKGLV